MRYCSILLLFLLSIQVSFAQIIRISGKVTAQGEGQPLIGVNITDSKTGRLLATTDVDGRYAINAHSNATLKYSMIGAETVSVKVNGRK
ncbi:MAG: carboxypeptidase-like regulatory domain-containing protein, partial [Clostridia bacterium]|nr:carboxypeptidase-like regulatory domain-containing protein [Clostridia bacterium]